MSDLSARLRALAHPDPSGCLKPTRFLNCDHPALKECVEKLDVMRLPYPERASRLFYFVRDDIQYEFRAKLSADEYVASYTLEVGCGFCTQKAVLLAALGRAAAIPTAIALADLCDRSLPQRIVKAMRTNRLEYHGFTAFHLGGRWLHADATLSPSVVKRRHYRSVKFDGHEDAFLAPTTLRGDPHVEYEVVRGIYADLPFEEMYPVFVARFQEIDIDALIKMRFKL